MTDKYIKLLNEMTLEEKASLCSGLNFWETQPIERLGIPKIMVTDGPHGMRKQSTSADHLGINESVPATCFPSGAGLASSWNKSLMERVGETLAVEAKVEKVSVLLGPAVNIKRSPLCGRNFEYLSEDPYLSSHMGRHHIKGMQSKGIGTSIKHYAANNQETRRFSVDTIVDERTLREIYLASFETAIREEQPWTVMSCYNRVNGIYGSESEFLLNQVLREEWGYKGIVVTDWGANNDRVLGLEAGQDLEMPGNGGVNDKKIVEAVKNGELDEEVLDKIATRMLEFIAKSEENLEEGVVFDKEAHHKIAQEVAAECMVLLKNDENILPLNSNQKIAVIGELATNPRYQGGGSSHINPTFMTNAREEMNAKGNVSYAQGYHLTSDDINEELVNEAKALASKSDVVVIFVGLPDSYESEGYDRTHLNMPPNQDHIINELAKVHSNVVVVISTGAPVEMPWVRDVNGIFQGYLGGQAGGAAIAELLYGEVNPSGKLAETFPLKLKHNPSYENFPGDGDRVEYKEGIFVGYRYYEKKEMDVLFPFGHGLSYTNFEYTDISVEKDSIKDTDEVKVSVKVKNVGECKGKEIVQLYVHDVESKVTKAVKELKGFEKVELNPGEEKEVEFTLDKRSFAYYETKINDWYAESGEYTILVGGSSASTPLSTSVEVESTVELPIHVTKNTPFVELYDRPEKMRVINAIFQNSALGQMADADSDSNETQMLKEMLKFMNIRSMQAFSPSELTDEVAEKIVRELNK